ncbi:MAG: hypothetical protein OJF49_001899 [Ktedonobacterales bacterium]|jgi:predicted RNase H-like HicB family nuclease|nr:MAG: hypothetical protein OJF49_001899 [Ktedonobacterales bacterium]
MSEQQVRYSILIEWSNLDDAYIASFPEWERLGYLAHTHGETYAEAAQKGQDLLTHLIASASKHGDVMPAPALFDAHAYAPGETEEVIVRETQQLLHEIEEQGETPVRRTS